MDDIDLDDPNITDEELNRVVLAKEGTTDTNKVRRAGIATARLKEREDKRQLDLKVAEMNMQSDLQQNMKKFMEGQRELSEKFQSKLAEQNAEASTRQFKQMLEVAKRSNLAAWGSAVAAGLMAYLALKGS
ncbi:MAG: hypothetical protein ISR48_03385 [Alphaproteobacteria bacterium]|nr:hypothetical protein [Alphaproteobacteria bacterium]